VTRAGCSSRCSGRSFPYVTLFAAVVLAAWHAGTGYALLASALGLVAAQKLFVHGSLTGEAALAGSTAYLRLLRRRDPVRGRAAAHRARRLAQRRGDAPPAGAGQGEIDVRRRAESALALQKEWLRVTLASIGDGVLATTCAGASRC
jgi:hypothetical protein